MNNLHLSKTFPFVSSCYRSIAGALLLSILSSPSLRADGLAETFTYPNGNLTTSSGATWQRFEPTAGDATVVSGAARYEDTTDVIRPFPGILTEPGQSATWSFTIKIAVANTSEGYEISLQPTSVPFAANTNYASGFSLGFDYAAAPAGMSSIQVGEGAPNTTGPVVGFMSAGVTHAIRIEMARGTTNTAYSLFLDNTLLATRSFVINDFRGLNSIEFDQAGATPTPSGNAVLDYINIVPQPVDPSSYPESVVEQWVKRYNGPANSTDQATAVAGDNVGNVLVTGYSYSTSGGNDYYTAKYAAANGALLWEKRYNFSNNDQAYALVLDGAGNVIVTGSSFASAGMFGTADYYTAKYAAANGALLWEKRYAGYNGQGGGSDEAYAVTVDSAGNVIVTGASANSGGNQDYYTAKYAAANGAQLWEKRYNGTGNGDDTARALAVDSAGNVIITGTSVGSSGSQDYYTAKYAAANGALLWEKRYNGPNSGSDEAYSVAVDSAGNAIVTGFSWDAASGYDYYTAKYASANGALLWEKRYNGPGSGEDIARAVAVDSAGNAIVTGSSHSGGASFYDYYTAKYASADGTLLWEKRYSGPGSGNDYAYAVVVDNAGNAVVTGYAWGGGSSRYDYYTAKYAAADGALLWEKRYDGPGGGTYDYIEGYKQLALTPDGGVVVTGYSDGGNPYDYATVKYIRADADDDGLLDSWEVAHFGTAAGHSALDDTDGDGRIELLELAFATDPLVPDAIAAPAIPQENGFLITTITKQPGVKYLVQTAAMPDAAAFSATTTTVLLNTATTLTVRDNIPMGSAFSRFLRVQVTAAP